MNFKNISFLLLLYGVLTACSGNTHSDEQGNEYTSSERIKLKQYFIAGERLYAQHCSNCHKQNGEGLARLIPPLKGTDLPERDSLIACIIKNGLKEEIMVNGVMYNQPMPANLHLTNLEIAEISTYLHNQFFGETFLVTIESVNKALSHCEQ